MNACKSFMHVAKEIWFKTIKAVKFVQACSDHYKTWRLCEILQYACTDKLLEPYMLSSENPTVDGYWVWVKEQHEKGNLTKKLCFSAGYDPELFNSNHAFPC